MTTCYNESGHRETYDTDDIREAAQSYVDDGDWGVATKTVLHLVWCKDESPCSPVSVLIAVDPDEPPCDEHGARGHEWHEIIRFGHGGGVVVVERCACGIELITDTWAQCRADGSQGHRTIEYRSVIP